jgi:hypothetical protein
MEGIEVRTTHTPATTWTPLEPAPHKNRHTSRQAKSSAKKTRPPLSGGLWAFFFGIFVPAASYLVEIIFSGCSLLFFDPMPTVWHHVAVLGVVFINAATWYAVRYHKSVPWLLACGNRAVIVVSIFFGLIFIPVVPLAMAGLLAVIYWGIGLIALLPLGPYFTLLTALALRRRLATRQESITQPRPAWGYVAAAVLVALMIVPSIINYAGMRLATSDDPDTQAKGLDLLRNAGNRSELLRSCYRSAGAFDNDSLLALGMPDVSRKDAREIYYRVTGEPFNRDMPKTHVFDRRAIASSWDNDVGGDTVGGRRIHVALEKSHMEASLDPDAGLGYLEWVLEFGNSGNRREEARSVIELPAGAVVSRVTLWINGIEQEAAYAGKAQVRRAYESVVRVSRDPVLVTSTGPDQVLLQCFPIQPNGGKMKTKVGITFPLAIHSRDSASIPLPRIIERNFEAAPDLRHEVSFTSTVEMADLDGNIRETGGNGTSVSISDPSLRDLGFVATVERDREIYRVSAADYVDPTRIVQGDLIEVPPRTVQRFALVIDGSRSMAPHRKRLRKWVRSLDLPYEVRVYIAHDRILDGLEHKWPSFGGGTDNGPALAEALDWAGEKRDSIVCWVHGPQPVKLSSLGSPTSEIASRLHLPEIHHLQVEAGPNQTLSTLLDVGPVRRIMPSENPVESLHRFIGSLSEPTLTWKYSVIEGTGSEPLSSEKSKSVSDHLVRMWKFEEIRNLLQSGEADETGLAEEGARYHLVTAVSGAVVLETQAQYDRAGLEPIDSSQAATHAVPEPGSLPLLLLGGYLLVMLRRRVQR